MIDLYTRFLSVRKGNLGKCFTVFLKTKKKNET